MGSSRWCLVALTAVLPLSIRVSAPADSVAPFVARDGTRFEVLGGTGEYAFITRGCEGQVLNTVPGTFRDAGARVEHSIGHGMTLGVRGGVVHDDIAGTPGPIGVTPGSGPSPGTRSELDNAYVNPYFTYEQTGGSVGFGWVAHQHEFVTTGEQARTASNHPLNDISAHLRIGQSGHYFAIRWMEGVPLASSGGYMDIGMGEQPAGRRLAIYGGLGTGGPYEGAGLLVNGTYHFPNGITTSVRTRLGFWSNHNASGVAVGFGYGVLSP